MAFLTKASWPKVFMTHELDGAVRLSMSQAEMARSNEVMGRSL